MLFLKATLAAPGRSSSAVGSKSRPQAAEKDIAMLQTEQKEVPENTGERAGLSYRGFMLCVC